MPESTDGESTSASPDQEGKKLSIADIIDNQLETSDEIEIGRVADIEAEWREDGSLVLTQVVTGPQALAFSSLSCVPMRSP